MSKYVVFKLRDVIVISSIILIFVGFLVYGFLNVKKETPNFEPGTQECWDYYGKISGEKALEMCSYYGK